MAELRRRLEGLKRRPASVGELPAGLAKALQVSLGRAQARRAALPRPAFPEDLPVNQRRGEIAQAIAAHQVVIVCGETGSGKTTQLPKICLQLGRGARGLIGHTQPRRIAARATAARIAQELKSELGRVVGYKIRFTDRTSADSHIKLMTDGILLAETQGDPLLSAYDTIIIDEAHERSLNIDFLLGYLRQLLPRRPELKVIVTSATLDADRFARHFADGQGRPAPIVEVSGRLYPVEVRYRPVVEESRAKAAAEGRPGKGDSRAQERDLPEAIADAVAELQREGPGDVLVFLPGEREIREAAEALRKHHPPGAEILPLFARQSAQEQQRVFSPGNGRRVVLATNVAETSLTVPGIRYVVDTGMARVKRYSHRNKVEQLQIEPVAQSAARQRAGRCGRVAAGVCIRLYAEEDFAKRPAHTDPEILRSSLAGVILRMRALGLPGVLDFPFLDAPAPKMVSDGYQLLTELGAVDDERELTAIGKELSRLPTDPKIGRMVLAARDAQALREVLIIASALSVQDPRERPQEAAGSADQAHAQWKDERSEFLSWVKLWDAFDAVWRNESTSKQRQWCRRNFLNYLRMREWRDVHGQLHVLAAEHGWRENQAPATYEQVHCALLAGLLGHVGLKVEEAGGFGAPPYQGARGIKFLPHPGSPLAKKAGKWIMAAELVETSRLFARCLARIEPEWLESVGAHLVRRQLYEPHWEKRAGQVMAYERATLHGLLLYARKAVSYSQVDPVQCRQIFIREALVAGELPEEVARRAGFFEHNRKLIERIAALEHKTRRPDVLVDEALIEAFYDQLLPPEVCDVRSFEAWRRKVEQQSPRLLYLERDQLMRHEAAGVTTERFPHSFPLHGQKLKLAYRHEHGASDDGVTLTVPLALLNQIPAPRCEWLVPGLLAEKIQVLVKTVPQKIRHRLQPLAAYVDEFCAAEHDRDEPLLRALVRHIEAKVQLKLPPEAVRCENLAPHLLMNFRLVDEHGRMLGQSRSLAELRSRFGDKVEGRFAQALESLRRPKELAEAEADARQTNAPAPEAAAQNADGVYTTWAFGALPEIMELTVDGRAVIGFPALVDEGESVRLKVFDTPEKAAAVHQGGLRRLFTLAMREQVKYIEKSLPGLRELALLYVGLGNEAELKSQLVAATLARTCMAEPLPTDAETFSQRKEAARPRLVLVAQELVRLAQLILTERASLNKKLHGLTKSFPEAVDDVKLQLAALVGPKFLADHPFERLQHFPRYLKAAALRLDKLRADPARDARLLAEWRQLARPWEREWQARQRGGVADPELETFRWHLEELRVQLFAQELRTPAPVSVKRLQKIWDSRQRL